MRTTTKAFTYRCDSCRQVYTLEEANDRGFFCHDQPMERVRLNADRSDQRSPSPLVATDESSSRDNDGEAHWVVRRILPPPENEIEPEAMEQLLGSLHATRGVLSLEIAGDAHQRQMLVRGTPTTVNAVTHQLQAAYGHVSWQDPEDSDPALTFLNGASENGLRLAHCEMELRRPIFFPIKTWRAFEDADPLRVLLGAFRGLHEDEQLLSQLVLLQPASDDWADAYQGTAQQVDFRMATASLAGQARAGLFALGIILGFVDLLALFVSLGWLLRPGFGAVDGLKTVLSLGLLAAVNAGVGTVIFRWWRRLSARLNANPDVVQRKVSLPAYRCMLRLWATAPTSDRAEILAERVASAYRLYNSAEGNALCAKRSRTAMRSAGLGALVRPDGAADQEQSQASHVLPFCHSSSSNDRPLFRALGQMLTGEEGLVLNLAELAGLWHMPVGEALELVQREGRERFVPLPEDVSDPDGVHVGRSVKDDQTTVRVSLSRDAISRNTFMIGKTQMGKSNLMEILARHAMEDRDRALVVLDPQGDMARHLRGIVPSDRVHQTYYLDFADRQRVVGLNLLDMTLGIDVDKVVSDLIGLGEALWSRFWGPRMEATWRYATKSLALINQRLVAEGQEEEQYTLLDVPPLLLAPKRRRQNFLTHMLPWDSPEGKDAHWWWNTYYEELRKSLQQDVISPVLTKVFRVAGNSISQTVFGQ